MKTYIAFLRGINVSGQKKIRMADLRISLQGLGFTAVETYIQSGNLVIKSENADKSKLAKQIYDVILADFKFEVPTLVMHPEEISAILENNPFLGKAEVKNLYFTLPYGAPQSDNTSNLCADDYPNEEFYITDHCVYLNCKMGAGKAKLNNNIIERKLGVIATTRNLRTLQKIILLAQGQG